MAGDDTLSAKQVARRIGTEAKILRKFFRDPKSGYDAVGQGGRYDFDPSDLPEIQKKFDAWNAGKARRNRPTNAEREASKKVEEATPASQKAKKAVPRPRRAPKTPASSAMDQDDLMTRCRSSIGERAKKHGLTTDQRGQWKPLMTVAEARDRIPGFAKSSDEAAKRKAEANKAWQDALQSLEGDQENEPS